MDDEAKVKQGDLPEWLTAVRDRVVTVREAAGAGDRPAPADAQPPPVARLIERGEIGRGGMGSVHRVTDTRLLREIAMKRLEPELAKEPARVEAFVEEAQITGQLEHPNIVPVHDLAVDAEGHVFFTMKLVRGVSLQQWLDDPSRPVGSPERLGHGLEIFLKVCDAISFAHSCGVLHRDLKPANIMVGPFGEVYVMDWGLARLTGDGVHVARTPWSPLSKVREGAVGTLVYMSPEQARANLADQDQRTDVFGLGALLYQVVTGETPYAADTNIEVLKDMVRRGAIREPERVLGNVGVSKRILRIIRKALAPARGERFGSVAELKGAVQRFLHGGLHLPREGFLPGTPIVVEGEPGDRAYIIVSGECVAYRLVQGEKLVLRQMSRGDIFGELAVLSDKPRSATVEAVTKVTTLVVSRAELEDGLGGDHSWLGALVKALADRFRELDERSLPESVREAAAGGRG